MFLENGVWVSEPATERATGRPALLLDRDGVLVREVNYLSCRADVQVEVGAADLIRFAHSLNMAAVVVTNQSGIARGLFDWAAYEAVHNEMICQLAAEGVRIDFAIACPFHPDFTPGYNESLAQWRKPGSAMIEHAAARLGFDKARSWMIGDSAQDMEAAKRAGLAGGIHVLSGHGAAHRTEAMARGDASFSVRPARDAEDALTVLRDIFSNILNDGT